MKKETKPDEPSKKAPGKVVHRNSRGEIMSEFPPRIIPDSPALERCRDVLYSIAKKMCEEGTEATGKIMQASFPGAKTIGKHYVDHKMKRTIEWEHFI